MLLYIPNPLHAKKNIYKKAEQFKHLHLFQEARDICKELRDRYKINVSVTGPSSTLLDSKREVDSHRGELIRASVHYYNDEEEIERFISALDEIQNSYDPL